MTVKQVVEEVERDLVFYEASDGGLTVSGGEPFEQPGFLESLLKACKAKGMATAVETSGYASWHILESIIPYVDLILYDIKHFDSSRHRQLTGVSNNLIMENARRVADLGFPLALRYTVIPGFNDGPEDREALFRFAKALPGIKRIDLLPYHRLGESKYAMLDRNYALTQVNPLMRKNLEGWVQGAKQRDLEAHIIM
jgi:pyruvate formate lyase activating enzyme